MKKAPPLILSFFVADAVLALLYLINWKLGQPFDKITVLLDLDGEANLPTWYSSIQLFLTACFFGVFAYRKVSKKEKVSWLLLVWPLVFVFLSLDETAQIHEWLGRWSDVILPGGTREHTLFWSTGIWMFLLGVPFFVFMLGLILGTGAYLSGRGRAAITLFFTGLLMFVGAVAGIEFIANLVQNGSTGQILEIFFEDLVEMIGETFFLWGAYEMLRSYGMLVFVNGRK